MFLCPLSMATGYLSVLLQSLGALRTVCGIPTTVRGRSDWLRAQPEVVQTHGHRNCLVRTYHILLTGVRLPTVVTRLDCSRAVSGDGTQNPTPCGVTARSGEAT